MHIWKMDDQDLKRRWVELLRSGEIEQTRWEFERESGCMCVLGVLCKAGGEPTMVDAGIGIGGNFEYVNSVLHDQSEILWYKNDHQRLTFPQLADWIEANL